MEAAQTLQLGRDKAYVWIGTDAWSSRESVVNVRSSYAAY